LKEASALNAKKCIIVGDEELRENKIKVKDMATGEQKLESCDEYLSRLAIGRPVSKQGMLFDV
jgi:histidyl-tRNA synthetase